MNLVEKDRADIIKKAIDLLEPMESSIISLYYIQGNSVKEISEITSLSLSNIKIKLFRARKTLSKILSISMESDLEDLI